MLVESSGNHIDLKWKGTIMSPCNPDFSVNIVHTACFIESFIKQHRKGNFGASGDLREVYAEGFL